MKKVMLISPGTSSKMHAVPPLGLAYLASAIRDDYDVTIYDMSFHSEQELEAKVSDFNPDYVGVTCMTPHFSSFKNLIGIVKLIKDNCVIVAGGPHPTLFPKETLEAVPEVDYIVIGEGEITFKKLLDSLSSNTHTQKDLLSLAYREEGAIHINPRAPYLDDLNMYPTPARDLLTETYRQLQGHPNYTAMITSRGCPYSCIFCAKEVHGRTYRERDLGNIKDELYQLYSAGVRYIAFFDDSFTLNKKKVTELSEWMKENTPDLTWKCETRVNLVDPELLETMKDGGCRIIAYGVESGVQKNLDFLRKQTTPDMIKQAVKQTQDAGIMVQTYFMIGIPNETEEEMEQTRQFALDLNPDYCQFSILTPIPGTDLYVYASENNLLDDKVWEDFQYCSDRKTAFFHDDTKLLQMLQKCNKSFYIRPGYFLQMIKNFREPYDIKNAILGFGLVLGWLK